MPAPCIVRLDQEIYCASTEVEKARLIAEKATYLARIGESEEAERLRQGLRQEFGDGRDLGVSVRLMILEAVQSYFKDFGRFAADRLARAKVLSVAAANNELITLSCAWLSHIKYYEGDYSAAVANAELSLARLRDDDWASVIRLGLLFGDMHLLCGNRVPSQSWYEVARLAAISYGDQAAVGALIYNRASLKVFGLRIAQALGAEVPDSEIRLVAAECRSATNYQYAASVKSLDHLLIASQAGLGVVKKDYSAALEQLAQFAVNGEIPRDYPYRLVLMAEIVLCYAALQKSQQAREVLACMPASEISVLPPDDYLLTVFTLTEAAALDPQLLPLSALPYDLPTAKDRYLEHRQSIAGLMTRYTEIPERLRVKK